MGNLKRLLKAESELNYKKIENIQNDKQDGTC